MGGEPLMTNDHRRVLRSIKDLSKVEIQYITNGMFMLTPEDVVLLNNCTKVKMFVSIDAYGKLNEQIRIGSDWNQIEKFVDDILNNTNILETNVTQIETLEIAEIEVEVETQNGQVFQLFGWFIR